MKKIALIIVALLTLSLGVCAQNKQQKEDKEMKKTLIVYFSATGTTKAAAQKLAKEFNADLYEITPEVPYTAADLDWRDKNSRSTIVNTFIEAHDLSGKTLNVFATSGGSDVKGSYNDLKKAYPQYTWGENRLMNK